MIPLRDENPTSTVPFATILLIMVNVLVWAFHQGGGMDADLLFVSICRFGMIPGELTGQVAPGHVVELAPGYLCQLGQEPPWLRVFTSMFLHGSWLHLIANMWFLWIFGHNIEESVGRWRFLGFYLFTGLAGAMAHVWSAPDSLIPTVGASGAVSGVMGAYLALFPRVRIQTLFVIIIIVRIIPLPAWVLLGYWFMIQVLSGAFMPPEAGGVAFWAHIGGFVAGAVLVRPVRRRYRNSRA